MKKHISLLPFLVLLLFVFAQPLQAQSADTVYITDKGEKYHDTTCRYLNKSKNAITLEEAQKNYDACKACNPTKSSLSNSTTPVRETNNSNFSQSYKSKSSSVQCSGKTKAGNRCKRKTTASNGRCYQHYKILI